MAISLKLAVRMAAQIRRSTCSHKLMQVRLILSNNLCKHLRRVEKFPVLLPVQMVALLEVRLVPSVSKKQERFMQAVAHNPAFAKKAGVPQSVGKEFTKSGGGMAESKKMVKKEVSFMKSKGAPKSMIKHEMGEMKGMKKGGMAASKMGAVKTAAPSRDGVAVKGKTKGKNLGNSGKNVGIMGGAKGMKKGGYC
jgi:hypothetical protein